MKDFGLQLLPLPTPTDDGMNLTVPYPFPTVLQSKELFFIQSFESYESVVAKEVSLLLEKPTWKEFNSVPLVRDQTIKAISTNKPMLVKMKQLLSDAVTNR